ncbi:MAG: hypothetical protein WCA08_12230 [Desulfoferrobacter sp.]
MMYPWFGVVERHQDYKTVSSIFRRARADRDQYHIDSYCVPELKIADLIDDPDVIERIFRLFGLWKQQAVPSERKTKATEHVQVVLDDFDPAFSAHGSILPADSVKYGASF